MREEEKTCFFLNICVQLKAEESPTYITHKCKQPRTTLQHNVKKERAHSCDTLCTFAICHQSSAQTNLSKHLCVFF